MNENVSRIIADAIKVIECKGWTKGTVVDHETEHVCALGALDVACRMGQLLNPNESWADHSYEARRLVSEELNKVKGYINANIPSMNDAASTTQEDILLGLKHALVRAEQPDE